MKSLIRAFVFNLLAFRLAVGLIPGVTFAEGFKTLIIASITLALFNFLVKPLVSLLLLPINLLTLGMFRWVVNVFILYLLTITVAGFSIAGFDFPGLTLGSLVIPPLYLNAFWNTVLVSFFLSFVTGFLSWLK